MSRVKSVAPYRTHRRRGESFGSCLLMIVLVLGGALFAWSRFGKNRPLIQAGEQILAMKDYNQGADLEYRKHFRDHNKANAQTVRTETKKFYDDTIKGKYAGKASDFDQAYYEMDQRLLDSIGELDMNQVPRTFMAAHKKMSAAHKYLYECLENLKKGYYAEGDEKKKAYAEANEKLKTGWAMSQAGEDAVFNLLGAPCQP